MYTFCLDEEIKLTSSFTKIFITGILFVLIIVGCSNSEGGSDNTGVKIEVSVEKVGDILQPKDIKVKHKQDVTINIKSDVDGTFHIHGYNLEKELKSGQNSEIRFLADATGRFPLGFHKAESSSKDDHDHDDHEEMIIGNFIVEPN